MLFSQREGLTPLKKLQGDDVDQETRNRLWNAFEIFYWSDMHTYERELVKLINAYWHLFFKKTINEIPRHLSDAVLIIRTDFLESPWFRVYDHIEFVITRNVYLGTTNVAEEFSSFCNNIFSEEKSAYRIVGGKITKITSPAEIESIDDALAKTGRFPGVQMHLISSLNLLSNRKNPDYRNSIKESISAVEAICQILANDSKAEFGTALKILEDKIGLHGALKKGFSSLYGYTSDADGIRHAMLDVSNLTFIDAKFMLVTCTAFINYMIGKAADLRIEIKQ